MLNFKTYIIEKLRMRTSFASKVQTSRQERAKKYFKFIKFLQNLIYFPDVWVMIENDKEDKLPIRNVTDNNGTTVKISKWWPPTHYYFCSNKDNFFSIRIKYNEADLAKNDNSIFLKRLEEFIDNNLYRYECIDKSNYYLILNDLDKKECKYLENIGFTKYPIEAVLDYMNDPGWSYGRDMYKEIKPQYDKNGYQMVFISFDDLLKKIDFIYNEFYDEDNDAIDEDPETIEDIKDDGELENNDE